MKEDARDGVEAELPIHLGRSMLAALVFVTVTTTYALFLFSFFLSFSSPLFQSRSSLLHFLAIIP